MPKIYLSPSTQEKNRCTTGDNEEQHMNKIVDFMEPLLVANGIEYARNTPAMTHISSTAESNKRDYDLHYALHSNALNGNVEGARIFYASDKGKEYADIIAETYKEIYSGEIKVVNPEVKFTELFKTKAISILDEIAFHDNPNDSKWIHGNLEAIAENKVKALCRCFGIEYKGYKEMYHDAVGKYVTLKQAIKELVNKIEKG